jgi:primase-polymerase (primpol)-like protein
MSQPAARSPAIEEMIARGRRFVWWKRRVKKNGKVAKVPYGPNGKPASSTDPATWGTLAECVAACKAHDGDGIGFVFTGDGLAGVDLDGCRDPQTGAIAPWAQRIIDDFASYTEVSPSGTGVKIYFRLDQGVAIRSRKWVIDEE